MPHRHGPTSHEVGYGRACSFEPLEERAVLSAATPPLLQISNAGTPQTVAPGGTVMYTVTVTNTGSVPAAGAVLTDGVTPGAETLVFATDASGTVTISGDTVTDKLGTLAASSGTETLTITAVANASLFGTTTVAANAANVVLDGTLVAADTAVTTIGSSSSQTTPHLGFFPGVPGDSTPQMFVRNLYVELLGREPDTAGDSFWVGYLQQHNDAAGRAQASAAFMNSHEYAVHYLTTVYENILGRAPDPAGLAYWAAKMGSPGTPGEHSGSADEKQIVAALFGSDEFYIASGNTPQSWVNTLYEDILGRAPDSSGAAFWAHELATRGAGDRDGIVSDLLTTPEAAHYVLDGGYLAAGGPINPGGPVSTPTKLEIVTGNGWENLYLQGPYDSQPEGNDAFFDLLAAGAGWDDVQWLLLNTNQFYSNPNP